MNELPFAVDLVMSVLLLTGAVFTLTGSLGLLKLNSPMSRLHAPTLAATLGVGSTLLASMTYGFFSRAPSLHEMLVMAFLFVTAPISANFIAKVHLHRCRHVPDLPQPPADKTWATRSDV